MNIFNKYISLECNCLTKSENHFKTVYIYFQKGIFRMLGCCYQAPTAVFAVNSSYRQISNISRIFVGNIIVDHLDVVGAFPVGAAPTTSSFSI